MLILKDQKKGFLNSFILIKPNSGKKNIKLMENVVN